MTFRWRVVSPDIANAAREALPVCDYRPGEFHQLLDGIAQIFLDERAALRRERAGDKRKLEQALGAAEKLRRLINEVPTIHALSAGADRAGLDVHAWARATVALDDHLDAYIALGEAAIDAPPPGDIRRDEPLNNLLMALGAVYTAATGQGVVMTYDPVAAEVSGPFFAFIRIATAPVLGPKPPSDEALRARVRELIELGRIAPKIVGRRLYRSAGDGATDPVARLNDEVTDGNQAPDRCP